MKYLIRWHKCIDTIILPELCYDQYGNKITNVYLYDGLYIGFNLRKMLSWAYNTGYWFFALNGRKGADVAEFTRIAIDRMYSYKSEAQKFTPEHGSGNYEECLLFLNNLLMAANRHPNLICEIYR